MEPTFADASIADFVARASLDPLDVAAMRAAGAARVCDRARGAELAHDRPA